MTPDHALAMLLTAGAREGFTIGCPPHTVIAKVTGERADLIVKKYGDVVEHHSSLPLKEAASTISTALAS